MRKINIKLESNIRKNLNIGIGDGLFFFRIFRSMGRLTYKIIANQEWMVTLPHGSKQYG